MKVEVIAADRRLDALIGKEGRRTNSEDPSPTRSLSAAASRSAGGPPTVLRPGGAQEPAPAVCDRPTEAEGAEKSMKPIRTSQMVTLERVPEDNAGSAVGLALYMMAQ